MYLQIITFRLDGISPDEFAVLNDRVATQYGGMPGLISKIFLADPDDDHAYGGVYLWETRDNAERYLQNGPVQILVNDPRFVDLQTRTMVVLSKPTSITGGPVAGMVSGSTA
ncbi:YdhR family protein [Allosalinactinospora lopnorensis]|uniref:YdhR family protein n=1 Tax=Allosalinactinospora lopnorensis TaxID=1352348 RepID=UPI000623C2F3|nr:YdhR family protein [Allosalinactinospora lopnorensis]